MFLWNDIFLRDLWSNDVQPTTTFRLKKKKLFPNCQMTNLWLICSWAKLPRRERRTWWWSSPAPAEQSRVPQARPLACPKSLRVLGFAHCPVRRDKEDNVVKSWCFGENGGNAVTAKEGVLLPSAQLLGYQREAGAKVKAFEGGGTVTFPKDTLVE